jgi:hypothetical protein
MIGDLIRQPYEDKDEDTRGEHHVMMKAENRVIQLGCKPKNMKDCLQTIRS